MLTIQKLNTNAGPTELGKHVLSEAGKALAHIPGFKAFYDAEFYKAGENFILNRASGKKSAFTGVFDIVSVNGKQALRKLSGSSGSVTHDGDYQVNSDTWTFFAVFKPVVNTNTAQVFKLVTRKENTSELSLYNTMSASSKTLTIYRGTTGGDTRISFSSEAGSELANLGHPSVIMFSFSSAEGLKIRLNGKTVASSNSSAAKEAIMNGLNTGEWDWLRNANGDFYAWGGFNIDLTTAENVNYLQDFERYFMNKYSIAILA